MPLRGLTMTANELADELDNWYPTVNLCRYSAIMLRQQQAEIEALKLRELSNEEIMKVWQDSEWGDGEQEDILFFAKALLKCASGNILSDNEVKD